MLDEPEPFILDFKLSSNHEFIMSLKLSKFFKHALCHFKPIASLENKDYILFKNIQEEELDFLHFIQHNFPNKVGKVEFEVCEFNGLIDETINEIKR